jgi:hypothetical protein
VRLLTPNDLAGGETDCQNQIEPLVERSQEGGSGKSKTRRRSLQKPIDERCSVRPVAGYAGFSSKLVGA